MDFTAYIQTLSVGKRTLLYQSPWTSLAVFRNLPPLGQQYVMRLLFLSQPFPKGEQGSGGAAQGTGEQPGDSRVPATPGPALPLSVRACWYAALAAPPAVRSARRSVCGQLGPEGRG